MGQTQANSITGLKLDQYPDEPWSWERGEEVPSLGMWVLLSLLLLASSRQRRKLVVP